jgi:hypothetical protein
MTVIAPKAKGRTSIVAPKPQSRITPDQLAKALGASSVIVSEMQSNPLHAWQAARERLIRR